jgi:type VI secretion system Hcp family effector
MKSFNATSTCFAVLTAALLCAPVMVQADILGAEVSISSDDLTLVSSVRTARTVQQYTISAIARNQGNKQYRNVTAQLISVPTGITVLDGNLNFGNLAANSSASSTDEFVIQLNLRTSPTPQLSDMRWQFHGDEVLQPPAKPAQSGIFISFDNNAIKGEVRSASHDGWIELLNWQDGALAYYDATSGGSGAGKAVLTDVAVTKFIDSASPLLREALVKGRMFDEVKIDVIRSCNQQYYTQYAISLFNVLLSSVQAASNSGNKPVEQLSLNIRSAESSYTPVGPDCQLQQPIYSYQTLH